MKDYTIEEKSLRGKDYYYVTAKMSADSFCRVRTLDIASQESIIDGLRGDRPHCHGYYQLVLIQMANGSREENGISYTIEDKSISFVSLGALHRMIGVCNLHGLAIEFSPRFLDETDKALKTFVSGYLFNFLVRTTYHTLDDVCMRKLENIANNMLSVYQDENDDIIKSLALTSLLSLFLCTYIRYNCESEFLSFKNDEIPLFLRFHDALVHNIHNGRKVGYYLDKLKVNQKDLYKACISAANCNPSDYIDKFIISEAKRLLLTTDRKVKEIAFMLGFADNATFSRFFRRETGETAQEFRDRFIREFFG